MTPETHLVEWKESWRDDYLRWLCGFASADRGMLVIGRNDKGVPVGVPDADRLLVDLPNKIRDTLGIIPPVRAVKAEGRMLVEIEVEPPPRPSATGASTTSARAARSNSSRAMRFRPSCCASSGATGTTRPCLMWAFRT